MRLAPRPGPHETGGQDDPSVAETVPDIRTHAAKRRRVQARAKSYVDLRVGAFPREAVPGLGGVHEAHKTNGSDFLVRVDRPLVRNAAEQELLCRKYGS